jgi:hypothetical protein
MPICTESGAARVPFPLSFDAIEDSLESVVETFVSGGFRILTALEVTSALERAS